MDDFNGVAGQMRNSKWLASEDFDAPREYTIEKVVSFKGEPMQDGRKADGYGLRFVGKERGMVLNATNRKALVLAYGVKVAAWAGKTIILHAVDGVRSPKGGTCMGIRIKECK